MKTDKMYVTFKKELHRVWDADADAHLLKDIREPSRLGYAAAYEPGNQKTDKKNKDQLAWTGYIFNNSLGQLVEHKNYRWVWPDNKPYEYNEIRSEYLSDSGRPCLTQIWDVVPIDDFLKPQVFDNVPRQGFKVVATVSRMSTSNKLWRILDPYGFELEISTANMEELIMTGNICSGLIIGFLYWDFGKNGIGKATLKRKESA